MRDYRRSVVIFMKKRISIARGIAILLIFTITIISIPMKTVYASEDDLITKIQNEIKDDINEAVEIILDASSSHTRFDNWWLAISYNRLPPNTFHIAVQDDIVKKNGVKKELQVYYKDENNNPSV